jgi:hypothetical protein
LGIKRGSSPRFIDFEKTRKEDLYNILMEICIPMKLLRIIKLYMTETHSRVRVGKNVSDMFPIRKGMKQGDGLPPLLSNSSLEDATMRFK